MVDKNPETQEQSIKARKRQLFESDEPATAVGSGRPFREFLKTTPASPLSTPAKAGLWAAGALVALVLVAALLKMALKPPRPAKKPSAATTPSAAPPLASHAGPSPAPGAAC